CSSSSHGPCSPSHSSSCCQSGSDCQPPLCARRGATGARVRPGGADDIGAPTPAGGRVPATYQINTPKIARITSTRATTSTTSSRLAFEDDVGVVVVVVVATEV